MSINSTFATVNQFLWIGIISGWALQRIQRKRKHHLTHEEVLLEWAYAEVKSPRWTERFIQDMGEENFRRIVETIQAQELEPEDKQILIAAFRARRGWMLDRYFLPTTRYEEIKLDAEELANLQLIPEMLPKVKTLREYANSAAQDPNNPVDSRNVAAAYLATRPPPGIPRPPIIVQGSAYEAPMLLEGYTRTIGFLLMLNQEKEPYKKPIPCIVAINDRQPAP